MNSETFPQTKKKNIQIQRTLLPGHSDKFQQIALKFASFIFSVPFFPVSLYKIPF